MNRAAAASGLAWRSERMRSVSTRIWATPTADRTRIATTPSPVADGWSHTHRTTRDSPRSTGPGSNARTTRGGKSGSDASRSGVTTMVSA